MRLPIIAVLLQAVWLGSAAFAQPLTDRELFDFYLGMSNRIQLATSDSELNVLLDDIETSANEVGYETALLLIDAVDQHRLWLDPFNDPSFVDHATSLAEVVEFQFRDVEERGLATSMGARARWRFYEGTLRWQRENPGFSGLERWGYGIDLMEEILNDPDFSPANEDSQ
ncbi:hypothetical protein A8B78_22305 [Jannaschia sp. EhC01]|nr:hypothetical protein A8B78_22305 [Jannaschia sp. EhC01]